MNHLNIPVGVSDFAEIRKNNYYYIDKTGLISRLLRASAKVTLITRPRRFGKTLGMNMLSDFFDIRKESKDLFAGLEISKDEALCQKWMNQYPTLFLSFKKVDGLDFTTSYGMLCSVIAELCVNYSHLLEHPQISSYDKEILRHVMQLQANPIEIRNSLQSLIRSMQIYYQKPVIVLIDEYDVPVAKATANGYYPQMLDVMKGLLQPLKDNPSLCFAVITGCLKIAKESIFTGTNNFVSDTIRDFGFNEYFGFTQSEVDQLLDIAHAKEHSEQIKHWYDGYHFGDFDIYCPWDVMNYLRDLSFNPDARPASYWRNTSDNAIIRSFIDYSGSSITKKLEQLLSGGFVIQKIDENLTYDYLHSSEDNLWSILYLTGYLTTVRKSDLDTALPDGMSALIIPNAEIRAIFETTVIKWFDDNAKIWNRKELFDAVWRADNNLLTQEMSKLLRKTISYHDYREDFYHAFLAGIFAGAGYMVESNKEHGEGRSDVIVYDPLNSQVAIFEAKYAKSLADMQKSCETALQQMDDRMYAKEFEDDYDHIFCYGISFFKKRCLVRKK